MVPGLELFCQLRLPAKFGGWRALGSDLRGSEAPPGLLAGDLRQMPSVELGAVGVRGRKLG